MSFKRTFSHPAPASALPRYSAKNMAKPVTFICTTAHAKSVHLIGDFNHWDPKATPMKRQPDGAWMVQISLSHGHHQYQFLVDGRPELDPRCHGTATHRQHHKVSLIAVS